MGPWDGWQLHSRFEEAGVRCVEVVLRGEELPQLGGVEDRYELPAQVADLGGYEVVGVAVEDGFIVLNEVNELSFPVHPRDGDGVPPSTDDDDVVLVEGKNIVCPVADVNRSHLHGVGSQPQGTEGVARIRVGGTHRLRDDQGPAHLLCQCGRDTKEGGHATEDGAGVQDAENDDRRLP